MVECVRRYGCLTCFVLLFSGPMVVSPLSRRWSAAFELDTSTTDVRRLLYCCNTWWVGGSLRGRHCCSTYCCTAVSGWVDRFVAVASCCGVSTGSCSRALIIEELFSRICEINLQMRRRSVAIREI